MSGEHSDQEFAERLFRLQRLCSPTLDGDTQCLLNRKPNTRYGFAWRSDVPAGLDLAGCTADGEHRHIVEAVGFGETALAVSKEQGTIEQGPVTFLDSAE